MSNENQDQITFDGLQRFLLQIGFEQPAKVNQSLAIHHPESGAMILLSLPQDGRSVRSADLVSVLMRFEHEGLGDDSVLAQIKAGKLPRGS